MTTKSEKTEIEALQAKIKKMEKKAKKAKKKAKKADNDFQGIWLQKATNGHYAGGMITTPKGEKVWLCIFPNKYFKKKGKWPVYHITVNEPKASK
jgi:hypothetical protein